MKSDTTATGFTSRFEPRASRIEVRGFLAFGGPPRRRGWTRLGKLVRLDPGRGPGTRFERIWRPGRGGTPTPNRPFIADRGLIAQPRPGACGFAIQGRSPTYRRCIAYSRSMFPPLSWSPPPGSPSLGGPPQAGDHPWTNRVYPHLLEYLQTLIHLPPLALLDHALHLLERGKGIVKTPLLLVHDLGPEEDEPLRRGPPLRPPLLRGLRCYLAPLSPPWA